MTDSTEEDTVDSKRGSQIWHALRELGFRWLVGGVASLVVLSGTTSAGVAVWAASRADINAVSQNATAIRGLRDTLATAIEQTGDVDDAQDRMIADMRMDIDSMGNRFGLIIDSQAELVVRLDRLLCRMDGTPANTCEVRYRDVP